MLKMPLLKCVDLSLKCLNKHTAVDPTQYIGGQRAQHHGAESRQLTLFSCCLTFF